MEAYKKTKHFEKDIQELIVMEEDTKKIEPSPEPLKGKAKKEIRELKREYQNPPDKTKWEYYLFLTKNPDFIIVDY